jgi:phenylpyruvate tautomerase PptA (4-oxalocrotonate tautomerase family)
MSVEVHFPLEFIVEGTPVSLQAARPESIAAWKERIVSASRIVLPESHFASSDTLAITLFYFPAGPMQGDIDNIIKPILDALSRHVYLDDHQIHRVVVQKFEPGNIFQFSEPTATLTEALNRKPPALYVRLSDEPFEDLE